MLFSPNLWIRQNYRQSYCYRCRYSNNEPCHRYSFLRQRKQPAPVICAQARYYIHNPLGFPMNVSIAPIIQQILPQITPAVEALLNQMTQQTMPVSVDSLINQLVPLKPATGNNLAAAAKAGILEATVLTSQLTDGKGTPGKPVINAELLKPATPNPNNEQQYKVQITANKQSYELVTKVPLPPGTKIQLSIAQNNLATILTITSPTTAQTTNAGNATSPASNTTLSNTLTNTNTSSTDKTQAINTPVTTRVLTGEATATNNRPAIEQGIRQALPQQQPLRNLLPLIQQIVQQPPQQIPKELLQNLNTLLQQFPTSQQAMQAKPLQQAINNNGIFFEAKLAQQPANNNNTIQSTGNDITRLGGTANNPLSQDLKGMLQKLATQVDKSSSTSTATTTTASPLVTSLTTGTEDGKQALTYSPNAPAPLSAELTTPANTTQASAEKNVDVLLRQLSNQLLATLARTQLNQLESLAARQSNTPDNQGPLNSWTMELPIVHGKNIDNLEMRIDQHLIEDGNDSETNEGTKQWTVMLAFDLHALGKMNVQLKIIEKSVSATVWSQLENTHREVKQHVNSLSKNLEKIGVNVKHVDCQLGLPPKNNLPIYKQLVDVRT